MVASIIEASCIIKSIFKEFKNKFLSKFKNSFQHGGISMEEMIVPVAIMNAR